MPGSSHGVFLFYCQAAPLEREHLLRPSQHQTLATFLELRASANAKIVQDMVVTKPFRIPDLIPQMEKLVREKASS